MFISISKHTLFFLLGLFLIGAVACSPGSPAESEHESLTLKLIAADINYDTESIEAAVGQPIRLTLDNQGVLEHDFSIVEIPLAGEAITTEQSGEMETHDMDHVDEEPAVHVAAPSGGYSTVEFTPTAPGEYEFYCTVPGHREAGMEGLLVVK